VLSDSDELTLTYRAQYVHAFFLGWQQAGSSADKLIVPSQLIHGVVLALWLRPALGDVSVSAEVQNLGDARSFNFYGVPRPGRAFFLKTTFAI